MTNVEAQRTIVAGAIKLLEQGWTQFVHAEDSDGCRLYPTHPKACKWCSIGALYGAAPAVGMEGDQLSREACSAIAHAKHHLTRTIGANVETWNDRTGRTQAEVLAAFRATLRQLYREPAS